MIARERIFSLLTLLYGEITASKVWPRLERRLGEFAATNPQLCERALSSARQLNEQDAILITYGGQISEPNQAPLQTLKRFVDEHLSDAVSGVHILPCFPYSSDDGFSVIDYLEIDSDLGDWQDIESLGQDYLLMLDAVINHISQESAWFKGFRRSEPTYADYFITADPDADYSMVVRPRALPLLTSVETSDGIRHVWTTFSEDQIDLHYANPQVLLRIIDVMLHYVQHGAEIIRLDAIAYLWKEMGTSCIHLPQTHAVVKLWRAVLDEVAPHVILITETNVPHAENISYFGETLPGGGSDEAQMVYNFSLAPLILHSFQSGEVRKLSAWAASLDSPTPGATFFNFIASHDGIGVRPAEGILSSDEIRALADQTQAHAGKVSHKTNLDGSQSVYELNTTLFDFLNDPAEPSPLDVPRFLASQAILLSLKGVPGIYIHSLIGSRNCHTCSAETGRARSLNRQKFSWSELEGDLADPAGCRRQVFDGYRHMLRVRRQHPAFHPAGEQRVLDLHPAVFAIIRISPISSLDSEAADVVLCLVNVSKREQGLGLAPLIDSLPQMRIGYDLLTNDQPSQISQSITLHPYQLRWFKLIE